jgi:cytochrome c-type biogenesis protein CcmE
VGLILIATRSILSGITQSLILYDTNHSPKFFYMASDVKKARDPKSTIYQSSN